MISAAAGFVAMFPLMVALAGIYTWRCAARVKQETSKSAFRQLREQLSLGCRWAVPPLWYYMFELYHDERRLRALEYLYRTEMKGNGGIYELLRQRRASQASANALSDKALFTTRCAAAGVPVVEVLATADAGNIAYSDGGAGLPCCDLFFKPNRGTGGRGASRWVYDGDGQYSARDGLNVSAWQLSVHLQELSHHRPYIVVQCVCNHPEISDLSPGALNTIRALTCLNEKGDPELTHAVYRMARAKDAVVDNFHAGGIAAMVDLQTGTLGPATDMGLQADSRWWDCHPTTGALVRGRVLPLWVEVRDVAIRAHCAFADQVAIGWDIAITPNGPVVVEGNKSPDLDIIQRVGREPIGDSRFGELLARHVRETLGEPLIN
jgi:hypothetical protein